MSGWEAETVAIVRGILHGSYGLCCAGEVLALHARFQ